jgi:hypothetical protein
MFVSSQKVMEPSDDLESGEPPKEIPVLELKKPAAEWKDVTSEFFENVKELELGKKNYFG